MMPASISGSSFLVRNRRVDDQVSGKDQYLMHLGLQVVKRIDRQISSFLLWSRRGRWSSFRLWLLQA